MSDQFRTAGAGRLRKEFLMAVLGWIFLVLLVIAVLTGLVLLVIAIPDLRRYLAIKRM